MRINSLKKGFAIAASLVFASVGLSAQAAHAAPITINLYEAIGYAPDEIKAFNASQSTYQVVDVGGSTGPLLAKVAAEGSNPQWGLFWADGDTWAAAADTAGQLAPLNFKPNYSSLGKRLAPKNNSFAITSDGCRPLQRCDSSKPRSCSEGDVASRVQGKDRNERSKYLRSYLPIHRWIDEPTWL